MDSLHSPVRQGPRFGPVSLTAALALWCAGPARAGADPLYTYTLSADGPAQAYDEAVAVACLQGVINRDGPRVYLLSQKNRRPGYWLELFSRGGRWLEGRQVQAVPDIESLVRLAGPRLKGAVVWDSEVPPTIN